MSARRRSCARPRAAVATAHTTARITAGVRRVTQSSRAFVAPEAGGHGADVAVAHGRWGRKRPPGPVPRPLRQASRGNNARAPTQAGEQAPPPTTYPEYPPPPHRKSCFRA